MLNEHVCAPVGVFVREILVPCVMTLLETGLHGRWEAWHAVCALVGGGNHVCCADVVAMEEPNGCNRDGVTQEEEEERVEERVEEGWRCVTVHVVHTIMHTVVRAALSRTSVSSGEHEANSKEKEEEEDNNKATRLLRLFIMECLNRGVLYDVLCAMFPAKAEVRQCERAGLAQKRRGVWRHYYHAEWCILAPRVNDAATRRVYDMLRRLCRLPFVLRLEL